MSHTRQRHVLTFAAAFCAAALSIVPARAVSIELKDVASDRVERQRKAAEGSLPLPGTPDLSRFQDRLKEAGVESGSHILLRVFKAESELELWIRKGSEFVLFATYPVCHWSGTLGPKLKEGDKQTPEGFYTVTKRQLHRAGRWPRSLNLGFPNVLDKSLARSGSYILVHGGCSSVGCFAMTNTVIEEIYNLTEAALQEGQEHVPVHVFPFRMTEANLANHKDSPWLPFWLNIKEGHDLFERTKRPPQVNVCEGKYQVKESASGEGGDPGPLRVCGATDAAIQFLTRLARAAQARTRLPEQRARLKVLTSRLEPLRDLAAAHSIVSSAKASVGALNRDLAWLARARGLAPARVPRTPVAIVPQPVCNSDLPSCRKHMALQQRRIDKGLPVTQTAPRRREVNLRRH